MREPADQQADRRLPGKPPVGMSPEQLAAELERVHQELASYRAQARQQMDQLTEHRAQLAASRDRYAGLYDFAPVGYVTLDPNGLLADINLIGAEMLGLLRKWAVGKPLLTYVAESDGRALLNYLYRCRNTERGLVTAELWLAPRGGDPFYAQLITRPAAEETETPHFRTAIIDQTDRYRAERAVREREAELEKVNEDLEHRTREAEQRSGQLRAMAMELTRTEQRERRRLAELLHDHHQQILAAAKMRTGLLEGADAEMVEQIGEQLNQLLDEAIDSSRSLSRDLCPPVLYNQGLADALEWLARWFREQHALTLEVRADPEAAPESQDLQAFLFQSIHELLLNAVKHGGASRARVETATHGRMLTVSVEDNGAGGKPAQMLRPSESGGFGLFSIKERLSMLGGSINVHSAPGAGCRVTLSCAADVSAGEEAGPRSEHAENEGPNERPQTEHAGDGRPIRVMLVDDHELVRTGLKHAIQRAEGIDLVAEAADGREAVERVEASEPEIILMDASMPRMDGAEATRIILRDRPEVRVIGLSIHDREDLANAMREAGAIDYLPKNTRPRELIDIIRRHAGREGSS